MWKNQLMRVLKSRRTHYAAAAAIGFGAGVPAGYFGFKRFREREYDTRLEDEIARTKAFYSSLNNKPSPIDLINKYDVNLNQMGDYDNLVRYYNGPPSDLPVDVPEETDEEVSTVRAESDSELTPVEMAILDRQRVLFAEGRPHPLTEEAFFAEERGYSQHQYTYWNGDGVLTDGQEQEVFDLDNTVGQQNIDLFDQLSEDGATIYIRNIRLEEEYEITRDPGIYQHEVEGQALAHSDRGSRKTPRFYQGD